MIILGKKKWCCSRCNVIRSSEGEIFLNRSTSLRTCLRQFACWEFPSPPGLIMITLATYHSDRHHCHLNKQITLKCLPEILLNSAFSNQPHLSPSTITNITQPLTRTHAHTQLNTNCHRRFLTHIYTAA